MQYNDSAWRRSGGSRIGTELTNRVNLKIFNILVSGETDQSALTKKLAKHYHCQYSLLQNINMIFPSIATKVSIQ